MSSLGNTERGILENVIDNCIIWIPEWVPEYRKEEAKKMWMYEKAEDFLLNDWNDIFDIRRFLFGKAAFSYFLRIVPVQNNAGSTMNTMAKIA